MPELQNDQAFFASSRGPDIDPFITGQAIRDLWQNFSSSAPDKRYGSILEQVLSWSKKMDKDALALVPTNLRKEAQQLLGFAREYETILTEFAVQLKSQLNVPAKTPEERKERRREAGAGSVLNQRFAEEFAALANEPPDSIRQKNALVFMDIADALARMDPPVRLGEIAKTTFAGAKAQVAVTRLMENHGFVTITPDWRKPVEVYFMDTHAKVDFVAYNGDRLFFIDAKSRAMAEFDDYLVINHLGSVEGGDERILIYLRQMELADRLNKKISGMSNKPFEHYRVILPTHRDYVGPFGEKIDPAIARGILAGLRIK